MPKKYAILLALLLALEGCSTYKESNPARTATEQMLISTAAERATANLDFHIPPNTSVFVDSSNFEGTDSKYALATIRTRMLQQGFHLVDDKKTAQVIVELRSGALSTDQDSFLIGIPQFNVPVPLSSGPLTVPQLALYSTDDQKGVAKFAVTSYDTKEGHLIAAENPQYGFSHNVKKTVFFFFSWSNRDYLPEQYGGNAPDEKPGNTTTGTSGAAAPNPNDKSSK